VLSVAGAAAAQVVEGGVSVGGGGFSAGGSVGVSTPPPPQPYYAPAPQPVYAPPQPVYVQPQPVYVQPQPVYVQQPYYADVGRIRFGWDVGAGGVVGYRSSFALNFGLRLGWQLSSEHAVFYQGNLPIAFFGESSPGVGDGGVFVAVTNAVMYEFTVAHLLHLGVGPSVDAVATSIGGVRDGWFFGAHGRIALTLGTQRPGRRTGFSLGLDLHPTFLTDIGGVLMTATGNVGLEYY
jgi:hypothetical protein